MAKFVRKIDNHNVIVKLDSEGVVSDYVATGEWEETTENEYNIVQNGSAKKIKPIKAVEKEL